MLIRRDYFERTGVKYGSTFCNMVQYYAMIVSAATAKRKIDGKKSEERVRPCDRPFTKSVDMHTQAQRHRDTDTVIRCAV